MPVYVFRCHDCGSFELSRPMAEVGAAAYCPTCLGEARRVFTPPDLTQAQHSDAAGAGKGGGKCPRTTRGDRKARTSAAAAPRAGAAVGTALMPAACAAAGQKASEIPCC
jgi:putative FmdB family regulatory protein